MSPRSASPAFPRLPALAGGLTAVRGLEVGHHTLDERPTGCTVVLARGGATAGVDVRGGAPGSRELALLDPHCTVEQVHAVVLSGGSAFGLDTASGVVRFLEEQGIGFETGVAKVPIVPAAVLYDLAVGGRPEIRPNAESGYLAAQAASTDAVVEGSVGAGAGASLGKLLGMEQAMKGGVGSAALRLPGGATIAALFAVNAFGDVIDPDHGQVVAGVRTTEGDALADARRLLRRQTEDGQSEDGQSEDGQAGIPSPFSPKAVENTTLGVVATDAPLTKIEASHLARLAHAGLARAISPCHTPWDGDTIFALATGVHAQAVDFMTLGALAAEVSSLAILRAVWQAQALPGLPAAVNLAKK